jgi:hypothetical protein
MIVIRLSIKRIRDSLGLVAILAAAFSALNSFSQTPPPNDNYSNSITLTGTDITFSGTLAGATIEDSQETSTFYSYYNNGHTTATQSVWWNWTAPTDTVLTVQILNRYPAYTFSWNAADAIAVYSATNGTSTPAGLSLPPLGFLQVYISIPSPTIAIPVTGGSNYQIQLIGNSSEIYNIRLVATNTPVIITQPRSQSVNSNASAMFYIVYAGIGQTNFTFQWYFNGTNLPGETAPMLALTNIDSSMAGTYTVAVSNAAGATFSAPATLTVSQSNFPVSLSAVGLGVTNFIPALGSASNAFVYSAAGEAGRSYQLQSSLDLTNWVPQEDFPETQTWATSIFFQTSASQIMATPYLPGRKYFRVTPYIIGNPDTEICLNNLRQIRIAKFLWSRDYNKRTTDIPQYADLVPYFPRKTPPTCPEDAFHTFQTSYVLNDIQTTPACGASPTNHILIEPQ